MLKKLLKYEWRDTSKLLLPINIAILAFTIIGCILLNTSIFDTDAGFFLAVVLVSLYILAILAFSTITTIYLYVRFYKNLYTREGYLMHTLPVTQTQLFHSKLIVGYFWFFLISVLTLLSTMALGVAAGFHAASTELYGEISADLLEIMQTSFVDIMGFSLPVLLLWLLIMLILSALFSVLMGYVSILLGQQVQRNKLAASVGFYLGIYFVVQIIMSIAAMVPTFIVASKSMSNDVLLEEVTFSMAEMSRLLLPSMTFLYLILCIAFYLICLKLLRRNVNLD